ncbi:sacsin N-terminal ATP-binding-like domain-containing protein [Burkholderia sp. PAMC 26561]|uniref:sacsin N-terminal ATP-binding-like domain-containing protein n=1 Tax=Burkholderia sp. PAMC 26561 TaxID=1795043 RepID=UPI00076B7733|nr:ATPase [Burkholderia sp. PAMC 26561]AME28690.1 ATPase [Burkholderia sp. PAMC 26561]
MTGSPPFFEPIRQRASQRWDQLECDPELAGPWHQLFKQVQSPRHILSELLQNADDAGATETSVRIEDRCFVFTHNGEDFKEEHFASLCRFGYSNKRALHTIGFRGIGFKSTFSLGDTVELYTPTLSVAFDRRRFTEPKWLASARTDEGGTKIKVAISDEHRQREVEKNLQDWLKSPVSLLFFKHIRRLRIGDQEVHWGSLGPGPVPGTEWMTLHQDPEQAFLVARSEAEPFPPDALTEIRQERLLGADQDADFPACKVELVLGTKGRLYVVLPTGVETSLPFACNAPFIQDPARLKIKDPETSPTNRWLLERVGTLAAAVMVQWLGQSSSNLGERSRAYGLLPDVDRDDSSLEGTCGTIVEEALWHEIQDEPFLLTHDGELRLNRQSVVIPEQLLDVWPPERATMVMDSANRAALSCHVSICDREKLVRWGAIEVIGIDRVLEVLQAERLPRPKSWRNLLNLWTYIAPEIAGYRPYMNVDRNALHIIPVQGRDVLYAANEVIRLGEKRLLQSEADWEFLAAHLLVVNQNWPRFLAEQRRSAAEHDAEQKKEDIEAAFAVLKAIGLEETSEANRVVEQVAVDFFNQESIALAGCVQLAQIAAKLGATAGETLRFVTRDCHVRSPRHVVLVDHDGTLEDMFPENWRSAHLLHDDYSKSLGSCTSEEWLRWISSGRSGLQTFVPFIQTVSTIWGHQNIRAELQNRGFVGTAYRPYVTSHYRVEDWNFEEAHWRYWAALANDDLRLWEHLVDRIFAQPETFWSKAKGARIVQVATTGKAVSITSEPLWPAWILKLRDLPCLPDTHGFRHKPADLLRRTPETESLMDVEPFVHGRLDEETTRPLLKLLGVRDTPTGPDRLLDCLRALAKAGRPPIHEVEKWYRRLDQMIETCSTADFAGIRNAFRDERIILTESVGWVSSGGVFLLSDDEDVPGAALIRASVSDLTLWRKIGIAERPTADLAIQWLKTLPAGKALTQDDVSRVRALLTRHAVRIWSECGHWINLVNEWVPINALNYAISMQSLVPWSHLHEWVKQQTADFQRLPAELTNALPFVAIPHLVSRIEDRFHRSPLCSGQPERKAWLNVLGAELCRIELDNESDTTRVRALAAELAKSAWQTAPGLEIIPYIDGTPAGTPKRTEVVWLDGTLYVDRLPNAKLARMVPDRLGKIFGRPDITAALNYCFARTPEEVAEYLEENFKLAPCEAFALSDVEGARSAHIPATADIDTTSWLLSAGAPINHAAGRASDDDEVFAVLPANDVPFSWEIEGDSIGLESEDFQRQKEHTHPTIKPSMIDRFAHGQGFRKDGADHFVHADGSWITKSNGDRFAWERGTAGGEVIRRYWIKDHCLEREPLQLDSDVWALIDSFPETYALVLSNPQGGPVEVLGVRIRAMRDRGELTLYPATYRLVFDHGREQQE